MSQKNKTDIRVTGTVFDNHAATTNSNDVHAKRLATIKTACDRKNYTADVRSDFRRTNILVDEKHSFMYCRIKKVGTSFWTGVSNHISGSVNNYYHLTAMDEYKERKQVLANLSAMFVVVRDPFERAIYGYVHKLFSPLTISWKQDGRYIENNIRGNRGELCGHNITFPEFVKYLIHSEYTRDHQDPHFYPMSRQCWPCDINYNVVVKFETFQQDAQYIFDILNKEQNLNLQIDYFMQNDKKRWTDIMIRTLFQEREEIEKCMLFYEAMMRLWKNFQIRGFIGINVSMPFTSDSVESITVMEYNKAYVNAKAISGSSDYKKQSKEDALKEAYAMVPMEDLDKLSQVFKDDCDFFGYDCRPAKIFNRDADIKPLIYFNI